MKEYTITFDNVTKVFPNSKVKAVNETSLTIGKGEFITIVGTSGSGKTTLLKMINRVIEPSSGTITVLGENILNQNINELRRKIGYVIQQSGLFPHMNVYQNISILAKSLKWDKDRIDQRVKYLMELMALPKDFAKRYPSQLSGGQQQRVGIARAMMIDPPIMLMDEPFGAIDAITRTRLQDDLLDVQKSLQKTIVFVTHDVEEAFKLGSKTIAMTNGTIQQYSNVAKLLYEPANDFVKQLVKSDNFFQQLSFTKVDMAMCTLCDENKVDATLPKININDSLSLVIEILIRNNPPAVLVVQNQNIVGQVTLKCIFDFFNRVKTNQLIIKD